MASNYVDIEESVEEAQANYQEAWDEFVRERDRPGGRGEGMVKARQVKDWRDEMIKVAMARDRKPSESDKEAFVKWEVSLAQIKVGAAKYKVQASYGVEKDWANSDLEAEQGLLKEAQARLEAYEASLGPQREPYDTDEVFKCRRDLYAAEQSKERARKEKAETEKVCAWSGNWEAYCESVAECELKLKVALSNSKAPAPTDKRGRLEEAVRKAEQELELAQQAYRSKDNLPGGLDDAPAGYRRAQMDKLAKELKPYAADVAAKEEYVKAAKAALQAGE